MGGDICSKKYHILETDDTAEYMWLRAKRTGLGVDVFVDDGGAYKRHKHPLVLLMRNSYNQRDFNMTPIYILKYPRVVEEEKLSKGVVSYTDINGVYRFIVRNWENLVSLSDRKIGQVEFFERIIPLETTEIKKSVFIIDSDKLMEYAWLRPQLTGLNVDVFVDDGGSYMRDGHELALLARNGYDESITDFLCFSVTETPYILNEVHDNNIGYDDIFQICNFIRLNLDIIQDFANDKISLSGLVKAFKKVSNIE